MSGRKLDGAGFAGRSASVIIKRELAAIDPRERGAHAGIQNA
jgi:hypothetical protein